VNDTIPSGGDRDIGNFKHLHDQGVLLDEEFGNAKAKLLNQWTNSVEI